MSLIEGLTFDRTLKAGFIGCGGHAFRNVYPALRYAPVDLVAVCDRDIDRARAVGRQFGARRHYSDHRAMLEGEELDCVFIVTGYDEDNRTTHAELAADCLRAGVSAWTEKPPVNDLDDVAMIREVRGDRVYGVGFKKAFFPANRKALALTREEGFGAVRTVSLRYAQTIPGGEQLRDRHSRWRLGFLDHLGHPLSILRLLAGPARSLHFTRAPNGGGFATFTMTSGAVASLHLVGSFHMQVLAERTEVNGDGATVIVENSHRVVHAPHDIGQIPPYGRAPDFTSGAPATVWEPEFSLGQLYNKALFLLGYAPEVIEFCRAVLEGRDVDAGGLDYAEEGIRILDAFAEGPDREIALV